jgi:leucyl-tRNA synthetase
MSYDHKTIEAKWIQKWAELGLHKTPEITAGAAKYYCLDMFPYPSGAGLHVGHVEGYTATDIVSRYMRMQGKAVLHPMGWDAFGLPAENYAIKTGKHPQETTDEAIKTFKKQIDNLGLSYDWDRELGTHREDYYKWTQWLFLKLYEKGLAYRKFAPVNWCPKDQTVLANEQVIDGKCERCDSEVIQKDMAQWFFKITDYAERLIKDLDKVDWPESTKLGQINWIGKSEGARIKFEIQANGEKVDEIEVFSTAHDTIFGATFLVIAPENKFLSKHLPELQNQAVIEGYITAAGTKTELERQQQKEKTGARIEGLMAINPMTNKEMPIYVADYVLNGYGTGAVMGVPGHDERDFEFANKYGLEIIFVTETDEFISYSDTIKKELKKFVVTNSGEYTGMDYESARAKMLDDMEANGIATREVNYRLRDWLVSRQRYWGAPIPMVYDTDGKPHPVAVADLPVILPHDIDFNPTGVSPLVDSPVFNRGVEDKYGQGWKRESDTLDTFVDSSWYFFRFADPKNETGFASKEAMQKWLPVDLYVGGAEHTVLHLLYARFFTKFLYDEGYITFDEPFQRMRHPGIILAEDNRKMSKRWGNVINPDDEIAKFGADTVRMYEMFMGPFKDSKPWSTRTEQGVARFLTKVWTLQAKVKKDFADIEQTRAVHKVNKFVMRATAELYFNTAVSKFMEFTNTLTKAENISQEVWEHFLKLMAPYAPFMTEELWSLLGYTESIHLQSWPQFDVALATEETITIGVQVNGKVRADIEVALDEAEEEVKAKVLAIPAVQKWLEGKEPKKFIYVKGKIVSVIA